MEWLNDEHFYGIADARMRIAQVIDIYNNKRSHLSLNYVTPSQAYLMVGEQTRKWKNYYKTNRSPEKDEEIRIMLFFRGRQRTGPDYFHLERR